MDSRRIVFVVGFALSLTAAPALAQLVDNNLATNTENAGINKTLTEQVGAGRGNVTTPDSSIFIIKRDPFRSIRRGRQIFQRKFQVQQGFGPLTGDGAGNIEADGSIGAGLVDSCAGCHGRPRGSAGAGGNVATRPDSRDAPHLFGLGLVEMLADEMTSDLRAIRSQAVQQANVNGTPVTSTLVAKGVNFGSITAQPGGTVDTSGVRGVDPDLRVKPFFAQGGSFSMREFAVGAFNAEMGLEAPDPDLLAASQGARVITPSGLVLDGSLDTIPAPPALSPSHDADGDGVVNELDTSIVDHMEFYLLNYFKAGTYIQNNDTQKGRQKFMSIGCGSCHVPDLVIERDRRVADVETVYDPARGIFNDLFSTAAARLTTRNDGTGHPPLKEPSLTSFTVRSIFSDLKRHDLGPNFWERNFDGSLTREFVTEPLWGVGSTAPYGHDGRSINLNEVILRHGGEAQAARDAFAALSFTDRVKLIGFLESLVLFPPDDTASNLDPGDPSNPAFPQRGHGSIKLTVLFNDPSDVE
ncbi:MAG TPA: di-heme oxidoredictase family protein [Thermoanaerobaculia bacterium]